MEFDRNLYPGTFQDKVKSLSVRTDQDTAKVISRYGKLLTQLSKIDNPDKVQKYKDTRLDPFIEKITSERHKDAIYQVDQIYNQFFK